MITKLTYNQLTTETFKEKAQLKFNNKFDYSQVNYSNSYTKIIIKCNVCLKLFQQTPANHLYGFGCKNCAVQENANKKRDTLENVIIKANKIHHNFYDYSKSIFVKHRTKMLIVCKQHGEFWQTPEKHIKRKQGCPVCKLDKLGGEPLLFEEFEKRAKLKHNNKYSYYKETYIKLNDELKINCPEHGDFWQNGSDHIYGCKCHFCSKKQSIMEQSWLDSLNIKPEYRKLKITINGKKFKPDAYDPETNTIYEFNGDYWHGNPNKYNSQDINLVTKTTFKHLYQKTLTREKLFKEAGYNIISIWEKDWKELNK